MMQSKALTPFGGTFNLGIKEAKRQGLKGKDLQAYKRKAWSEHAEKTEQMTKELEKAKKKLARKKR